MKKIIFDVDNTLIEKANFDELIFKKTSKKIFDIELSMQYDFLNKKLDHNYKSNSMYQIWKNRTNQANISITESDYKLILKEFSNIAMINKNQILNLSKRLCFPESLKELKYPLGIATSGSKEIQKYSLKIWGLDILFNEYLFSYGENGKNKSEIIKNIINKRDEILYVGDSIDDLKSIQLLKKEGYKINSISVLTGNNNYEDFLKYKADYIFKSLNYSNIKKLGEIIEKI